MAMPFIIYHDESIYSLEEKEAAKFKKIPRHHSKFEKQVKEEIQASKFAHKTMGFAEICLDPPDKFLHAGGGVRPRPKTTTHKCYRKNLPPVPRRQGGNGTDEKSASRDECGGGSASAGGNRESNGGRDFKKENAIAAIKLKPKRPEPRYVDRQLGDFYPLKQSGLCPSFIYQPKFGKLPKYLVKRIRDMGDLERKFRDEEVAQSQPLCRSVTQDERMELIAGLKHNWEELQKIYQGLPVLTDTIPKIIRKTNLEKELKQLEQDIHLVEDHSYIYVYNDEKH